LYELVNPCTVICHVIRAAVAFLRGQCRKHCWREYMVFSGGHVRVFQTQNSYAADNKRDCGLAPTGHGGDSFADVEATFMPTGVMPAER
jgi:hypothetical protein